MLLREVYNVFEKIHKAPDVCMANHHSPHAPPDRVLKEVTQQPKKVYNAPDVYGVTPVKALDALLLKQSTMISSNGYLT